MREGGGGRTGEELGIKFSAFVFVINIITVAIRKCRTRSCKSNEKLAQLEARSTLPAEQEQQEIIHIRTVCRSRIIGKHFGVGG